MKFRPLFVALTAVVGCVDGPFARPATEVLGPSIRDHAELRAAARGRTARGFEDEVLRMENALPGFGGVVRDSTGTLIVYVKDGTPRSDIVRTLQRASLSGRLPAGLRDEMLRGNRVTVRRADYSFSQLVGWQKDIVAELIGSGWLVGVDADEAKNRVSLDVIDGTSATAIESALRALAIPREAVVYRHVPPAEGLHTIRDVFRPTGGGVEISGGDEGACSLGFNVGTVGQNEIALLTASHCATGPVGSGTVGGFVYQDSLQTIGSIATIQINPPWSSNDPYCSFQPCLFADGMLAVYTIVASKRRVARTTSVGTNENLGSIYPDGWWDNIGPYVSSYPGMSVDKVGRTTGWTRGQVSQSCVAKVVPYNGVTTLLLCAEVVTGSTFGFGDSGGPVFETVGPSGVLSPVGIVSAGAGYFGKKAYCQQVCEYYFTPIARIQTHLGRVFDFAEPPQPPPGPEWSAQIYGTHVMQPGNSCTWTLTTNIPEPRTYQWSMNGVPVGTGAQITLSATSNFTLDLIVWGDHPTIGASATKSISVSNENAPCYDQ